MRIICCLKCFSSSDVLCPDIDITSAKRLNLLRYDLESEHEGELVSSDESVDGSQQMIHSSIGRWQFKITSQSACGDVCESFVVDPKSEPVGEPDSEEESENESKPMIGLILNLESADELY